ncbi:MAG: hypothetical protein NVS2B12_16020 [Ktedonobacteraceae bacterium]
MVALRIHGVTVDTADSAQKALEQIQVREYDAIVSDIKMPGMDGLELLAKIQEMRPEIPVMLITGHADQVLITQALRNGAYDFIQKPIDRVYFVAALHRAIQARQLRRQVEEQHHALEQYAHSLEQLVEKRTREFLAANEAMEVLVRDLLDTSLITSNRLLLQRTRCNLVELCQQVLHAYTTAAGLALNFQSSDEAVEVEVDQGRISQALIHLLFDARKNSPQGTPIIIMLQQSEDEAIVMIREVGGSAEELFPSGFEDLKARLDDLEATASTDSGLGFYLSQQIVERHGGRIELENSPGLGRTFSVILPLARAEQNQQEQGAEDVVESGERSHTPTPFEPPKWLIS